MSDNNLEFDPNQPFDVVEDKPVEFDPNQPFEAIPEEPVEQMQPEPADEKEALSQSFYVASKQDPEFKAKALKLANELQMPASVVERNYEMLVQKKEANSVDPDKLIAKTPSLAKWLSVPDNASLAKDDIASLEKIERATKEQSYGAGLVGSLKSGFFQMLSGLSKAPALAYGEAPGPDWLYEGSSGAMVREEIKRNSGPVPKALYDNELTRALDSKAKEFAPEEMTKGIIEEASNGNFASAGKALSYQIMSNIPQLGLLAASRGASLPVMLASSSGQKFAENLEAGVDPALAKSNALVTGGIETGVEMISGPGSAAFKESIKSIVRSLGKEGAKEVFKTSLLQIAKQAGAEGAEEFVTSASQDMLDYGSGIDDNAMDGIFTRASNAFLVGAGAGGSVTSLAMSGSTAARIFQKKSEAVSSKDAYDQIGLTVKESKFGKRSPEKMKEFIGQATEGTAMKEVFIPVEAFETYFQSKNIPPAQIAQQLGIKEKFEQAKETGADINIPMAEWVAGTIATEHYEGLSNDIKFSPEQLSLNQTKVETEQIRQELELQSQAAKAAETAPKAQGSIDYEAAAKEVGSDVEAQLKAAGRPAKEASAAAKLWESVFKTVSQNEGLDPKEFYKRFNLQIRNSDQAMSGDNVLNQSVTFRGVNIAPKKVGNQLALNPADGVEISGDIAQSSAGQVFSFSKLKTTEDYLEAGVEMITAMERTAARNGATFATADLKKMKIDSSSPYADLFRKAGYKLDEKNKVFTKKLEAPRVFNQSKIDGVKYKIRVEDSESIFESKQVKATGSMITQEELDMRLDLEPEQHGLKYESPFYLDSIEVLNESKKGKGLGSRALKVFEDHAASRGADGIVLNASPMGTFDKAENLDRLINFYEKNGYKLIQREEANATMHKPLNPTLNQDAEDPRGQIRFFKDGVRIELLKNADASTFIHESGHFFVEMMKDMASRKGASEQIKKDYQTLIEWAGGKVGEKIATEQHEKIAEGLETYFMEGKAPIRSLQKVFTQLKTWILAAYKSLINQRVELTDDVRRVFDRLLVSESAIQQAEAEAGFDKNFFESLKQSGMSDDKISKYQAATLEASQAAEEQIRKKLLEDVTKRDQAFYKEKKAQITEQVTQELSSSLKYNALYVLQKNTTVDGKPLPEGLDGLKISKDSLTDRLTDEAMKALPRGISSGEGVHLEIAAEFLGFRDGNSLIEALSNIQPLQEAINQQVEAQMEEQFPDYLNSPQISDDTVKAIHNEKRASVLRMELQYLFENSPSVVKDVIRRVSRRMPTNEMVKEQAKGIIDSIPVKDLKPHLYRMAEQRLRKEAGALVAKGDFDAAFEAKRKELLNFELYRAAEEARESIRKSLSDFRKRFRSDEDVSKTRDMDIVNASRALLASFGITRSEKAPADFLANMKKYDPDRYEELVALIDPIAEMGEQAGKDYKEVTYETFVQMRDTADALWDLAKSEREFEAEGKKLLIDEVQGELESRLQVISKDGPKQFEGSQTTGEAIKTGLLSFKAALTRVEHWARTVDGSTKEFTKYLWRPISDARNRYKLEKEKVLKQYLEISKILDKKSLNKGPIKAPEISKTSAGFATKKELLGALLHTGNESNLRKLLLGRGWGYLNEDGTLNTTSWDRFIARMQKENVLTKSDYDWLQAVWDLNESLKPDAQKAHKKMYGFYFNEITAKEIPTPYGSYRGGYVPAVADPLRSEAGAIRNEKEAMERGQNSFMFPSTGRGFTKGRVENYSTPLSIDLNLIGTHLDKVLRFIYLEPSVKQASRIVMNDKFRAELAAYDPEAGAGMLVPWLQRSASQRVSVPSGNGRAWRIADAFFNALRIRTGMQIMTANTINVMQNYTGIMVAAAKVKPFHIRNATWNYVTNSKELARMASEKSEFMKGSIDNQIADIQSETKKIYEADGALTNFKNFAEQNAYVLQRISQNQNNTIIWNAAYNQAIENGLLEKEAVQEADSAVRTTQGSLEATDVSRFETGSPFLRLFTQFYSYFNNIANLQASEVQKISREIGLRKGAGKLFVLFAITLWLPAITSEVIRRTLAGQGFDADDDEEYLDDAMAVFFGAPASYLMAEVPFAGSIATTFSNTWNNKHYDDRLNVSPVISTLESMVRTPKEIYDAIDETSKVSKQNRAIRDTLTLIGIFSGTPTGALARPLTYLNSLSQDEVEPESTADLIRGIVTGKTGNEGQ